MRNPFRDRTMRATFDAVIECYRSKHPDIWRPNAAGGDWQDRPGNAWAGNFWRGYDGNGSKNWDAHSRRTPGYACFRAGQMVRKEEDKVR